MQTKSTSNSTHLTQYREYERSALERARRASTDQERKSYLQIAMGWGGLATQLEQLYGVGETASALA